MKYLFFGSPRFAEVILKRLIDAGMPPLAVVTSPDSSLGRKQMLVSLPVASLAQDHAIPLFQPKNLKDFSVPSLFREADFFVVAAYAKIIPSSLLELPPLGTIGIHPSLLPVFRGPSPIQSMILSGVQNVGVSLYKMDDLIDHGPVFASDLLSDYTPDTLDYLALEEALALLGAELFLKKTPLYYRGEILPIPQNEEGVTFTKKYQTLDAQIEESHLRTAITGEDEVITRSVLRKILAFSKEPGAWTILERPLNIPHATLPAGKRIKIFRASISASQQLVITRFQVEGKNIVSL